MQLRDGLSFTLSIFRFLSSSTYNLDISPFPFYSIQIFCDVVGEMRPIHGLPPQFCIDLLFWCTTIKKSSIIGTGNRSFQTFYSLSFLAPWAKGRVVVSMLFVFYSWYWLSVPHPFITPFHPTVLTDHSSSPGHAALISALGSAGIARNFTNLLLLL